MRGRIASSRTTKTPGTDATLATIARRHIQLVLKRHGGNVTVAARVLGLHRRSLQRKIIRYGLGSARELSPVDTNNIEAEAS